MGERIADRMSVSERSRDDPRRGTGRRGELAAAEHLEGLGWSIIARNVRTRHGEIDLVCRAPEALVFIEVKTLRSRDPQAAERALESIGPRKRLQVRRLARDWLADNRPPPGCGELRFDAIGIAIGPDGRRTALAHVPAAF